MKQVLTPMKPNARVFLWDPIFDKLCKQDGVRPTDIDCRYLQRWFKKFPELFPKFMLSGNYTIYFNSETYRWEIVKGEKIIEFNPQHYLRY